jgi:hypothetical protein
MKFKESFKFLCDHPAFCDDFQGCLDIMVVETCKNGYSLENFISKEITIYPDDEKFKYLWENAEEKDRNYDIFEDEVPYSVDVEYEKYFGYPYEIDHTEIWLELGPRRKLQIDIECNVIPVFETWHDIDMDISVRTFEEGIIELANKVKDKYGDFSCENMASLWLKDNKDNKDDLVSSEVLNEIWWQFYLLKKDATFCDRDFTGVDVSKFIDNVKVI